MEKPELIEQRIEELKNQLQESKKYYQFELICTSKRSDKMIGFFNIRNGEKIKGIEHLKKSLSFDPNNADVLTKLGEVLIREP